MFPGKQTKIELLYARKCLKRLKKPQKHNLACNFRHMTIVFDFNHLNNNIYQIVLSGMFPDKKTMF